MKNKIKGLTQKQTKKMKLTYTAGVLLVLDKELDLDPNITVAQLWQKYYNTLLENGYDFAELPQPLTYKQ